MRCAVGNLAGSGENVTLGLDILLYHRISVIFTGVSRSGNVSNVRFENLEQRSLQIRHDLRFRYSGAMGALQRKRRRNTEQGAERRPREGVFEVSVESLQKYFDR